MIEDTGQNKRTTQRAIARADALGADALNKITNTSLDSGVELAKAIAPRFFLPDQIGYNIGYNFSLKSAFP